MNTDPQRAAADRVRAAQELYDVETEAAEADLARLQNQLQEAEAAVTAAEENLAAVDSGRAPAAEAALNDARQRRNAIAKNHIDQVQAVLAERMEALDAITAELPHTLTSVELDPDITPKRPGTS
ncbi:hypothetical protein AB0I28_19640 [Phytomonospora sp. NPDC050363]|uniref:hypothetical protein n=1 Tax=Phytomonospora sp. NPDC050363 TaxID=3155642 RepID=UPI0033E93441